MNEIITRSSSNPVVPTAVVPTALPAPKVDLTFRLAGLDDVPFMDALQKKHNNQLGHFPTQQFAGYIKMGGILIAEANRTPVGYCISRDRYLKRDELGVIFQLCVVPGDQRKFVGAALIREVFERSAYGCRLYCCWCAQDLAANHFWESLGFVPIAFRGGSEKKGRKDPSTGLRAGRVHIFWQKRIRQGDTTTPYWFPAKTEGGALRADRLVFPIPPGMRWSDAMPVVIPEVGDQKSEVSEEKKLEIKKPRARLTSDLRPLTSPPKATPANCGGGLRFSLAKGEVKSEPKQKRQPKPKVKTDPRLVAAARELRDRWMEAVNSGQLVIEGQGKYNVERMLDYAPPIARTTHALPASIAA